MNIADITTEELMDFSISFLLGFVELKSFTHRVDFPYS
jgi:hypothetical protein